MDSYKEFRQLIDKLDVLQKRLSNHINDSTAKTTG